MLSPVAKARSRLKKCEKRFAPMTGKQVKVKFGDYPEVTGRIIKLPGYKQHITSFRGDKFYEGTIYWIYCDMEFKTWKPSVDILLKMNPYVVIPLFDPDIEITLIEE